MTISSETRKAGPFNANDVNTTFPFTFKCFTNSDVRVVLTSSAGVESDLTLDVDYTVSLNLDQNSSPGGTVETTSPYATGEKITIVSAVDYLQETDIQNQGGFYPEVIENALDKLTMQAQQLKEQVDRSVKVDVSSGDDPALLIASLQNSVAQAMASASDANAAKNAAELALDNFTDLYLGEKSSDPALDNDGDTLLIGALYFNSAVNKMRVYSGSDWIDYESEAAASAQTATTQAVLAEIAKDAAELAQDYAEAAETNAEAAQISAETARDAAFVNANVYADTATGLAATSIGDQFQVVINNELIRYRHDSGPIATELVRFNIPPTDIIYGSLVNVAFAIVDDYGFALVIIDDAVEFSDFTADAAVIDDLQADYQTTDNTVDPYWSVVDEYGFTVAKIGEDGLVVSKVTESAPHSDLAVGYENHIILSMGQSLSIGVSATQIQTPTQNYDSKMLSGGIRTYGDSPYTSATLVPLVEASDADGGETPMGGASDFLNLLFEYENGITYTEHSFSVLGAATGVGSTAISSHVSGTTIYNRAVDVVSKMYSLSIAANDTAACRGVFWIQGESDVSTAQATYAATLRTLRSDFETSVKAATGQTESVEMFTYQTSSHLNYSQPTPNSALAQLAAANADANIYMVTPLYHMQHADGVHLTGNSSRFLGAYMALAYKRVIIDGQEWKCLQPESAIRQGSVCVLNFDVPDGPLVFDTAAVRDPGNYGFSLVDSGNNPLTISSVSLIGDNRVKIVAASAIPAGAKVRYAWGDGVTASSGPITGPRGCLRDSAGDGLPANFGKLHNWCVIFEYAI